MTLEKLKQDISLLDTCRDWVQKFGGSLQYQIEENFKLTPEQKDKIRFIQGTSAIYASMAQYLVKQHGKPAVFKPIYTADDKDSFATPREVRRFRQWAVKQGMTFKRTYRHEDIRRTFTITGHGRWEGFTFLVCCRQSKHAAFQNYCPSNREVDEVVISSDISCFLDGRNLRGGYGLVWRWFLVNDPETLRDIPRMTEQEYLFRCRTKILDGYIDDYKRSKELAL